MQMGCGGCGAKGDRFKVTKGTDFVRKGSLQTHRVLFSLMTLWAAWLVQTVDTKTPEWLKAVEASLVFCR